MRTFAAVGSSSGGHFSWWATGLIVLIGIPLTLWRLRRGGPGPQMNWIPRSMRGRANKTYRKHGWQEPFDDEGNRNPDRTVL
ncbi:hypothetical protein PZ938_04100 [Luteipulveratus sp. YIM 133132]|uniref:Uncharacterized protein n=1 Tax=Luteipulveratus flavus TaxID=3031728 RepID=A0ABT6C1G6_9MICO|nr:MULTISPECIES: hypothetical protein [unclassified Luteipulveratus]MDE9364776.1 hypothetical protein [Luteipulveratus sp. YIM 133132]MDF8262666.1 hypothetical protein [Luteipulveratus sp. YIM 133296]